MIKCRDDVMQKTLSLHVNDGVCLGLLYHVLRTCKFYYHFKRINIASFVNDSLCLALLLSNNLVVDLQTLRPFLRFRHRLLQCRVERHSSLGCLVLPAGYKSSASDNFLYPPQKRRSVSLGRMLNSINACAIYSFGMTLSGGVV